MGDVVRFPHQAAPLLACGPQRAASASKVMWLQDFSPAIRTMSGHRRAGMKRRARQVLTVDKGKSRAAATAPVPPKSSIAESTVTDMDGNIVRGLRTSQVFAPCEPTFSPKDGEMGSMTGAYKNERQRALAIRWIANCGRQIDFIRATGIAKSSWSEIENGKGDITLEMARKIKKKFHQSLDWTLDGEVEALSPKQRKKLEQLRRIATQTAGYPPVARK